MVDDLALPGEDGEEYALWKTLRWDVLTAGRPSGAKSAADALLRMVRPKNVHRVPLKAGCFSEGHYTASHSTGSDCVAHGRVC